ncbi:MAG: Holliday junction resolvase RuvX [Thermoanaerobaculales bacterium]|jgi:putative Holliday junction resolvase
MRWLALDLGSRRVGVAMCDADEKVVTALRPLAYAGPERLAENVERLVHEWGAGGLVVGVPCTRTGQSRGERRAAAVVAACQGVVTVPIELEDERGTSAAAAALLAEAGVPRRRWAALVDSVSARIILESHLATAARKRRGGIDLPPSGC